MDYTDCFGGVSCPQQLSMVSKRHQAPELRKKYTKAIGPSQGESFTAVTRSLQKQHEAFKRKQRLATKMM
jgi:hypothetical protein